MHTGLISEQFITALPPYLISKYFFKRGDNLSLIDFIDAYFDEQLALVGERLKRFSPEEIEEIEEVQKQLDELDEISE